MELTIWKYPLGGETRQSIDMPRGAKVLTVRMQGNTLTLWALVDPVQPMEPHEITVYGTGHPIPSEEMGRYVGTFSQDGWYIGHVFDWTPLGNERQAQ